MACFKTAFKHLPEPKMFCITWILEERREVGAKFLERKCNFRWDFLFRNLKELLHWTHL